MHSIYLFIYLLYFNVQNSEVEYNVHIITFTLTKSKDDLKQSKSVENTTDFLR